MHKGMPALPTEHGQKLLAGGKPAAHAAKAWAVTWLAVPAGPPLVGQLVELLHQPRAAAQLGGKVCNVLLQGEHVGIQVCVERSRGGADDGTTKMHRKSCALPRQRKT